ncbi:MAG: double zinc ribbon domain-containing protein [Promethearchaeota archaeon]
MEVPPPGTPIIIDIGSAYAKVGFAGDQEPRYTFPVITGTEKYKAVMADVSTRSIYVGDDAMKMRGVLKVKYPIQRGAIMDWNDYYEILNYIFYSLLRIEDLSQYPVLYIEPPFVQRENKEYIARVLFETHRIKSLMMIPSPLLSIFSVGVTTGLVIESGDGTTWIAPIINGQIMNQAVQRLNLAGIDVNHNLKSLLMREGISIQSSALDEILKEIKEKNCYFILDLQNPPTGGEDYQYPMPDGTFISIPHHILYEAPEVMFQPGMLGYNIMNIPQAVVYSLQMIGSEYWGELLSHIILSGGNVSYSGFEERLKEELDILLPQLGPIPKPQEVVEEKPKPKLQPIEVKKESDTCSQCGNLVDLSKGQEFCPSCGAPMKTVEISLDLGLGKKNLKTPKFKGKCPFCKKDISDSTSVFCPYCGKSMEALEVPEISEEIIEQAPVAKEFSGFYEGSETSGLIKFFTPTSVFYAIFNGASILASLPSFQALFVTHSQFQADSNLLYRDIRDILL